MNLQRATIILAVGILVSCVTVQYPKKDVEWVRFYDNRIHGELLSDDPIVIRASKRCSKLAFNKGVDIGGTLEIDGIEIVRQYNKSRGAFVTDSARRLGKTPDEREALDLAEKYVDEAPRLVRVVHRRMHIWESCFYEEEGFSKLYAKMPIYRVTGERLKYNARNGLFEPRYK